MGRYHFIRFLFLSFLFHQTRTSALFNLATLTYKLFTARTELEATKRTDIIEKRTSSISVSDKTVDTKYDEDEDFYLLSEFNDVIITESEYNQILLEIDELRNQILHAARSSSKKFEIIEQISNWRADQFNKFSLPWKTHFKTLNEIVLERDNAVYIPNSIVKEYLQFVIENVIISKKNTLKYRQIIYKTVNLLNSLIRTASNSDFFDLILKSVYFDLLEHQKLSIFNTFHSLLPEFSKSLDEFHDRKSKQKAFFKILKFYLKILNSLKPNFHDISAYKTPQIFVSFFELLPIYQALINEDSNYLNNFTQLKTTGNLNEKLKLVDFFLKESDFNNNFLITIPRALNKIRVFTIIKNIFFKQENLLSILNYCLTNEFIYIFELVLNYSYNDEVFFGTCVSLIKRFVITRKITISIYVVVLGACPNITAEVLDNILINHLTENPSRRDLNVPLIHAARKIILATENISKQSNWNMSERLKYILKHEKYEANDPSFFQAARIYLYRRFNIPFTNTKFTEDTAEEADWTEVIGFINFFIERECEKAKIDSKDVPKITTNDK